MLDAIIPTGVVASAVVAGVETHPQPPSPPRAATVTVTLGTAAEVGTVESLQVGRGAKWTPVPGVSGSTVTVRVEASIAMLRFTAKA